MVWNTLRFWSDPTPKLIILAFQGSVPSKSESDFHLEGNHQVGTKIKWKKNHQYSFCHILFQINRNLITLLCTSLHFAISFYSCGKKIFYLESYNGGGCQSSGDRNIISTKVTRKDLKILWLTGCEKLHTL